MNNKTRGLVCAAVVCALSVAALVSGRGAWARSQTTGAGGASSASPAGAASPSGQDWDGPAFSVDPATLFKTVSAITDPDEQDVMVFLATTRYTFAQDGRRDFSRHLVFKVLSATGVQDMASVAAGWDPWHQSQPVIRARVIDPDLSVHELDAKTLAEAGSKSDEQDSYTDSKELKGPLPALMPGAVVEETIEIPETQPLFAAGIAGAVALTWNVPVAHSRIILDAPSTLALHEFTRGKLNSKPLPQPEVTTAAGRSVWMLRTDNLPAVREEMPFLPPELPEGPEVVFSTAASWQNVAAAYEDIVNKQIVPSEAKAFADGAIQDVKGRDAIIAALVAQLHKEVRYTGVEFGESSLVPETTSEVLRRKYGDCKDKASLLVAMLRAENIPAYVALLSAGEDEDLDPEAPGMGVFDHAIVYVPGTPDLWIDATDQYARVGHLPGGDENRWALIVQSGQKTLVHTPQSTSADNHTVENRVFTLAEKGPAQVVEASDSWGSIDARYRDYFDDDDKKVHDQLESYMKDTYRADKLTKLDSTPITDFSVPFHLRLEADSAGRGVSESTNALVAIFLTDLTSRLPDYFKTEEDKDAKKPAQPRTEDFILPEPYTVDWQYHIIPPPGFEANALPEARNQQIGTATLTAQFQKNADGTVDAAIHFDTGKRRLTPQEADALRAGVIALGKEKAVLVTFNEAGEADLSAGKVLDALTEFRKLAELHPKEALHQDQIARALLAGGMGEMARAQAKHATELEPASADAYAQLAFVLEDDLIGRRFKKGWDQAGALAALQKAVELDPKNSTNRANYAILLEYNSDGVRYGQGARLNDAIEQYRLIGDDLANMRMADNLPMVLMRAKRFPELKQEAEKEEASPNREAQLLVARAAMDGSAAAISEAAQDEPDADAQRTALLGAGRLLLQLRLYPQAADLMEAGARGNDGAASTLALAAQLRQLKRHEDISLSDDNPKDVAMKFLMAVSGAATSLQDITALFTKDATGAFDVPFLRELTIGRSESSRSADEKLGVPVDVGIDLALAGLEISVDGSDAVGYRVQATDASTMSYSGLGALYLWKEDGKYRIAGCTTESDMTGHTVELLVKSGNMAAATQWLDWERELMDPSGHSDDDPTNSINAFTELWRRKRGQTPDAIHYTTAIMMDEAPSFAPEVIPILVAGRAQATTDYEKGVFDAALETAYSVEHDYSNQLAAARRLIAEAPNLVFIEKGFFTAALRNNKLWDEAANVDQAELEQNPRDAEPIRDLAKALWQEGKQDESQEELKKLISLGEASAYDLNTLAWNALVEDKVTPEFVQDAEHATLQTQGNDGSIVDTQAAIYAEMGKPTEAYAMEVQSIRLA